MRVLLLREKQLKNIINSNNIIGFLRDVNYANTLYIIIFIVGFSINKWFPHTFGVSDSILHFKEEDFIKILQLVFLLGFYIAPIYSIIYSKDMPKNILKYPEIKGVSNFSNFLENYSNVLPMSIISTGIVLTTLINFYIDFYFFGMIFLNVGIFLFSILLPLNIFFNNMGTNKIYNNLTRANYIINEYIISNDTRKRSLAIKEFAKHFIRVLDSIDLCLDKGVKINNLINKENVPVKQIITLYLPIYLKYSNEAEIKNFQKKTNYLIDLIDKKDFTISLDIVDEIYLINQDILLFFAKRKYAIPKNIRLINLEYNIKILFANFSTYFFIIFIIVGIMTDIIPYVSINKPIAELALILSPLFPILVQMLLKNYRLFKE